LHREPGRFSVSVRPLEPAAESQETAIGLPRLKFNSKASTQAENANGLGFASNFHLSERFNGVLSVQ